MHNEYHLHGPNSRVNVGSTDQSVNTVLVQPDEVFTKLRVELESAIKDRDEQVRIFERLSALETAGYIGFLRTTENISRFFSELDHRHHAILPALAEIARNSL